MDSVTIEEDGPLLLIGVNRPDAHNLWDLEVIQTVCRALRRLADSDHLRVGVIFGHGRLFTAGLDLASVAPLVATGDTSAVLRHGVVAAPYRARLASTPPNAAPSSTCARALLVLRCPCRAPPGRRTGAAHR